MIHSLDIVVIGDMSAELTPMSWQPDITYRGKGLPQLSVSSAIGQTFATPVVSPVNIIRESFEQHIIVVASS